MSDFRHLWDLDPEVVFLNHGSFGACPRPVLEHQTELRRAMERQPVAFLDDALEGTLDEARLALAGFISADPEGIAFVPNATTGVNVIVASLPLAPGDEIVITDHGYNACRNTVVAAAERSGAAVRTVQLPFAGITDDLAVSAVLDVIGPRTRLVIIDHVTSPTALVLPVALIAAALEPRGIPVLVDGAHGPGMLPVDVTSIGASYYVGNCHKWMCAPKGSGFIAAAPEPRDRLRPLVVSHGPNSSRTDRSRFRLLFDWTGTDDPTPYLAVPRAIAVMGGLLPGGWEALRTHNHRLVLEGRRIVSDAIGAAGLPDAAMLGSMAAIPLAPAARDARGRDPLALELRHRHGIEVPVPAWPQHPERLLRISAQAYNRIEDYERLAEALIAERVSAV